MVVPTSTTDASAQCGDAASVQICPERARPYLLAAAILASALGFIDGTVVAIAMPAMRESLGATLAGAQWISNAYMLSLSALILVGGALADRIGLVRVFGGGIALFIATSLVCAAATGPQLMIAARFFQGVGAAMMVPGSLALIAASYPPELRGRAIGLWASASAVTTAAGPVLGGLVLTAGGPEMWRWIFAINLPLGAVALWLLWRFSSRETERERVGIDWWGAALAAGGLGLLAWALTGAEHGGEGPQGALWIGLAGVAMLGVFLAVERRVAAPMMPLPLWRNRVFSAANSVTFFLYFGLSAVLFYLPMTTIAGWGITEVAASAAFLPLTIAVSAMSRPVGALADRVGPGWPIAIGTAIVTVAYLLLAIVTPLQAFWFGVMPAMILMGAGMGLVVAPLSTAVMGAVPDGSDGIASGINNAISRIAGLVAIAGLGGLLSARYAAQGGTASFGAPSETAEHVAAMNAAFQGLSLGVAAMSAIAAAIAFWFLVRPGQEVTAR